MTATARQTWRRAPGWGVVDRPDGADHGGRMYAAQLDSGVIHVLEGPAAVVCRAALSGLDAAGIRAEAARVLGAAVDDVDEDVVAELLDELAGLGVLQVA